MFNKFRAGSAFSRKRPAAAPAAPTQQRAVAAPATNSMFNKFRAGSAFSRKRPAAAPASPVQQRAVAAPNNAAQAAAVNQFNQSQQGVMNRANSVAQFNQGQQAAMQRFNAQPKAPTVSPQAAQQMSAMGPKMPAMAKGGMTKKPGYAKGGMAMCGASMPPAQKRKK
jgi:hypothetical protein